MANQTDIHIEGNANKSIDTTFRRSDEINLIEKMSKKTISWLKLTIEERIEKVFNSFRVGILMAKANESRAYADKLGLDYNHLQIGSNSGQHHHKQTNEYKLAYEQIGVLTKSDKKTPYTDQGYSDYGHKSLIFPLKNELGQIINFYSISYINGKTAFLNEKGVYPNYPRKNTQRLFICSGTLSGATFQQAGILENKDGMIALMDGKANKDVFASINKLNNLREIVLIKEEEFLIDTTLLDYLKQTKPDLPVNTVIIPNGFSLNDFFVNHGEEAITELLNEQLPGYSESHYSNRDNATGQGFNGNSDQSRYILNTNNPDKLIFKTDYASYAVIGDLPINSGSMMISLVMDVQGKRIRENVELFSDSKINDFIKKYETELDSEQLFSDLTQLRDELEKYRDTLFENSSDQGYQNKTYQVAPERRQHITEQLGIVKVIAWINDLLGKAGLIGEEKNGLLLFLIASTYKTENTLHVIVKGSTGSGKSYLINTVAGCLPTEHIINLSSITGRSLYNYTNKELVNRIITIQDWDGLKPDAQFGLRELQSAGYLNTSTTEKDKYGRPVSKIKKVEGHFSSLTATTHHNIYADNESRSLVVMVDESDEQSKRIINYTNQLTAGKIDEQEKRKAVQLLQDIIRVIQPKAVVIPQAEYLTLPEKTYMERRLISHLHGIIKQITILNQYQRESDEQDRLIATKEDIQQAIDILFDAIVFKVDDLDPNSRAFYERLEKYMEKKKTDSKIKMKERTTFSQKEIRNDLGVYKSTLQRLIDELLQMDYIFISGGHKNKGLTYSIAGENIRLEAIRKRVKEHLTEQLNKINE